MLTAALGDDRIEATRGLPHRQDYQCPFCGSPVVLHARTGGWVVPHFKHKPDSSCTYGKGETPEHRAVKALLRDHYRAKGYRVEIEYDIDARRADVFVPDLRTAFEVEFSSKETVPFVAKCRDYQRSGIRSLWILRQRRITVASVQVGRVVLVSISRVLDFMHSKHRPRGARYAFFACDQGGIAIFRGDTSPLMLTKPYDEYTAAGGYDYPSRSRTWLTITEVICSNGPGGSLP